VFFSQYLWQIESGGVRISALARNLRTTRLAYIYARTVFSLRRASSCLILTKTDFSGRSFTCCCRFRLQILEGSSPVSSSGRRIRPVFQCDWSGIGLAGSPAIVPRPQDDECSPKAACTASLKSIHVLLLENLGYCCETTVRTYCCMQWGSDTPEYIRSREFIIFARDCS